MKSNSYSELVCVTEAMYRSEAARMQALLADERRLRAELRQIEEVRFAARDVPDSRLQGYREIGADLTWQGWIGRSKANLHADLARVLGRKGQVSNLLRRAYGKYLAATELLQDQDRAYGQRSMKQQHDLLEELGRLKRAQETAGD
jgi:hypothetical protein|uniref:hypothetical protein n=1 Tax=Roseovarius sp. BRH_c41 TaxID=1629709 RepID=UPI000A5C80D2|nr:hypothetical protein [Roseovarius sp. BRH_c41]